VNHHDINVVVLYPLNEPLQCRPIKITAGIAAIVELFFDGSPSLVALALYVGETGIALGIK
jgi:hypothetical protein